MRSRIVSAGLISLLAVSSIASSWSTPTPTIIATEVGSLQHTARSTPAPIHRRSVSWDNGQCMTKLCQTQVPVVSGSGAQDMMKFYEWPGFNTKFTTFDLLKFTLPPPATVTCGPPRYGSVCLGYTHSVSCIWFPCPTPPQESKWWRSVVDENWPFNPYDHKHSFFGHFSRLPSQVPGLNGPFPQYEDGHNVYSEIEAEMRVEKSAWDEKYKSQLEQDRKDYLTMTEGQWTGPRKVDGPSWITYISKLYISNSTLATTTA